MRAVVSLALGLSWFLAPALAAQVDLSKVYTSTLKHDELDPEPLEWECSAEDVWTLASFDFEVPGRLEVALRASTLVLGRHGRDALWAVVLPEKPAKLVSTLGGEGERIEHVWLRFHPARLAQLFPPRTVRGKGPEEARLEALRIAAHKIGGVWGKAYEKPQGDRLRAFFHGYRPVVPPEGALVLDMDTLEGTRRVFTLEPGSQDVRLRGAYLTQALPKAEPLERGENTAAFERAASIGTKMRASGLELTGASWEEHLKEGRKSFQRATNDLELARAVHALLAPLHEPSFVVRRGADYYPAKRDQRFFNASLGGVEDILANESRTASGILWGRTPYGIGYVLCPRAEDASIVTQFDEVLDELHDTWGLIVDLRFGLEGKSEHVLAFAGRFVESATPFGEHSAGKDGSTALSIEPRGAWPYRGRVYALIGAGTAGEAERLALAIAALPKGETMGEPSAGLGLGARWEMLPGGVDVFFREGQTVDTLGRPLCPDGLAPMVPIAAEPTEFTDEKDPVLWRALEAIYLVPHPERLQAKNGEPFPWPGDLQNKEDPKAGEAKEDG